MQGKRRKFRNNKRVSLQRKRRKFRENTRYYCREKDGSLGIINDTIAEKKLEV